MKIRLKHLWLQFFALLFVVSVAHAQPAQQQQQSNFSQPELDQMLAPIALYPDALLSQILMASTYPTEVVEASYWLKANPELKGEDAVKATENQPWDISVKSLLPFPNVLSTMETKIDWTTNLGNAFLGQEQQVMDTIQALRRKAMAAGYLKSDNRVRVVEESGLIAINLVQPTAVYVPYYNPTVVYGTWWAPNYQPVYWDPWPGYAVTPGYAWAWAPVATVVTVGVLYAAFNWRHRHIYHHRHVHYWHRHHHYDHYRYRGDRHRWSHDYRHRREVPYRHVNVDRRFGDRARTYNTRVGPRPTTRDIRDGYYKPTRTTRDVRGTGRSNPYSGFKSSGTGRTGPGTISGTGRTGIMADPKGFTKGTKTGPSGPTTKGGRMIDSKSGGYDPKAGVKSGRTGMPDSKGGRTIGRDGAKGTRGVSGPSGRTGTTTTTGGRTGVKGATPSGTARGIQGTQPGKAHGVRGTQPGKAHGVRGTQPSNTKVRSTGTTQGGRTGASPGGRSGQTVKSGGPQRTGKASPGGRGGQVKSGAPQRSGRASPGGRTGGAKPASQRPSGQRSSKKPNER